MLLSSFKGDLLCLLLPLIVDCCSYTTIRTSYNMICSIEKGLMQIVEMLTLVIALTQLLSLVLGSDNFAQLLKYLFKVAKTV